jgi:hypothetical protein
MTAMHRRGLGESLQFVHAGQAFSVLVVRAANSGGPRQLRPRQDPLTPLEDPLDPLHEWQMEKVDPETLPH